VNLAFKVTQLATENKLSFMDLATSGSFNLNGTSLSYTSLTDLRDKIKAVSGFDAVILNNEDLIVSRATGNANRFYASTTALETQNISSGDSFSLSSLSSGGIVSLPGLSSPLSFSSTSNLETQIAALADYSVVSDGTTLTVTYSGTTSGSVLLSRSIATSTGVDANILVNGELYTSSSNRFSSLISGVNIDVKAVSSTEVELKTEQNTSGFVNALQTIVDGYNALLKTIKAEIQFDADVKKRGGLAGDSSARSFMSQLRRITTDPISGYLSVPVTLAQAGVQTNLDGSLSFDVDKIDELVNENPDILEAAVSSKRGNKGAIDRMKDLTDTVLSSSSPLQTVANNASSKELRSVDIEIERLNTQMDMLKARYIKQFTIMQDIVNSSNKTRENLTSMMTSWSASLKS
jgi:flagellar capping protein FliD